MMQAISANTTAAHTSTPRRSRRGPSDAPSLRAFSQPATARNLWPQRLADNELKDRVEPGLHEEVCGVLSAYDGTSSNAGRDRARLAVLSR
jgi:hypothetical protein